MCIKYKENVVTYLVDNLFHILIVLWENKHFQTSNLLKLLFHQRQVVPSSHFSFYNFEEKTGNQYFHSHLISETLLFDPPLIFVFLVWQT